jgi:hypothetical protein
MRAHIDYVSFVYQVPVPVVPVLHQRHHIHFMFLITIKPLRTATPPFKLLKVKCSR